MKDSLDFAQVDTAVASFTRVIYKFTRNALNRQCGGLQQEVAGVPCASLVWLVLAPKSRPHVVMNIDIRCRTVPVSPALPLRDGSQ